jgi:hypothetical protein
LPFVNDLIAALRPSLLVELGTHYGESYFGMCQAVQENSVSSNCYAVDTWQGDPHAGFYDESVFTDVNSYNERYYKPFSKLLRTTFDDARKNFADETIELLHIDGLHTYDAIRHDFDAWFPKVRPGGVVLLHDTAARHADFHVWRLWEEVARQYPHIEFHHSWGLGVLHKPGASGNGSDYLKTILSAHGSDQDFVRHYYGLQAELLERRRMAEALGTSTMDTYLQVYPCLADGYTEASSISTPLKAGSWQHVQLELPQGSGMGRIRVDPAHRPCLIRLAGVALRRAVDGSVLHSWTSPADLEALSPTSSLITLDVGDGITLLSTAGDPQLLLPEISPAIADQPLIFDASIRIENDLDPGGELATAALGAALRPGPVVADRARAISERDAARVRQEQLTAEIRNLQAERVALVADYRRIHGINDSLANEIASLKHDLATSHARLARMEEDASATLQDRLLLEGELQKRAAEDQRVAQENVRLANELTVVYQSRSWWLTAPLRRLLRALR